MDIFIGVDPGAKGGICALEARGGVIVALPFDGQLGVIKSIAFVLGSVSTLGSVRVIVEKVHSMPGQGVKSMFSFGQSYGEALGSCTVLGYTPELVTPQKWQSIVKGSPGWGPKDRVRSYCTDRWGEKIFMKGPRCKNPHGGMLDAAAIAAWGVDQYAISPVDV